MNDIVWPDERTWIEINEKALEHNVSVLESMLPEGCELMAVVKAEAYGHGSIETADILHAAGVRAYAVATLDEALELRNNNIEGEILILGWTDPKKAPQISKNNIIQTVYSTEYARALNDMDEKIRIHIKIDTGMHRLGFLPEPIDEIKALYGLKNLTVDGIFSHLCVADSDEQENIDFTKKQIEILTSVIKALESEGYSLPKKHIQSSYGFLNFSDYKFNYARFGIALYGVVTPDLYYTKKTVDLKPVLALKSGVVSLKMIPKGDNAGYGRRFTAERDTMVAILPVGYADGYPRHLSCGVGYVIINGVKAPIIGRICMDQTLVDVTDVPGVHLGSIATLIGRDGEAEITATDIAEATDTIPYEILSRLGRRLKVRVIND